MKAPVLLAILVAALALFAAAAGLFYQTDGQAFQFETLRGETVTISGSGLYHYDTISSKAQMQAQDVVTLALGIPVLLYSVSLFRRGALRGKLLLSGTFAYFLYTYGSMSFNTAYNPLFLVYVALFSLSLYGFVTATMTVDVGSLPDHFSPRLPRRGIASLLLVIGGFLALMWLGRIVPPLAQGKPPFGLESTTTLVIQALDLGIVVPLAILAGVLLLRRRPWGYFLSSIALIKALTLGTAVAAMAVAEVLVGAEVSPVELVMFPLLALLCVGMTVALLRNVEEAPTPSAQRPPELA